MSIESLSQESFAENLNTKFRVAVESREPVEFELIEVTPGVQLEGTERFSLIFRAGLDCRLPQSIYRLEHERLGALDIFLVPIKREADGLRYEAIFNRFVKKPEDQ
jgi:hypothetical protein